MANYAYCSLWFKDFTIERGVHHLEALLTLFPVSAARSNLRLVVRSLDPSQGVSLERELLTDPGDVRELAAGFLHDDTAYEVTAFWDLWQWQQAESLDLTWQRMPLPVQFLLQGELFDDGRYESAGHIWIRLGKEHLFTGHAGVLTGAEIRPEDFTDRAENQFAWALQEPDVLQAYRRRTCENIQMLLTYLHRIQEGLPVDRHRLWSEGEEDFPAVTEKILASAE